MTAQDIPRPRRSVLYVPSVNARAVEKAKGVDCDVVILDLEDSIAPDAKDEARATVLAILAQGGFVVADDLGLGAAHGRHHRTPPPLDQRGRAHGAR